MEFSGEQIERYSRHIILKEIGPEGQEKIINSKVLIIGVGGLGSPVALYLAAAGVGTIGLIDSDRVDMTNLQRQVIHFTEDIGKLKIESAKEKINKLNPDVNVLTFNERISATNISEIINNYDFIIDGTDNFPTKFLINDACVIHQKPYSHGGILRFDGQALTYTPGTACYRCVYNEPPPKNSVTTCSQAGVLGSIAGILGTIQATEALKFITNQGKLLTNRILTFNSLSMEFRTINVKQRKSCPVCGENPKIIEPKDIDLPDCNITI